MFLKERAIPLTAQKCQALLRNLPSDYPLLSKINAELSKQMSGYYGERSLDYHLSSLDEDKYDIYPGLRLSHNNRNFQIDTLILSNNYLLIVEVKNLPGELEFDSSKGQLIQKLGDKINVYDDPFAQVQQQKLKLMKWLEDLRIPPIPIDTLVVLSNNNALVKRVTGASNNYWKLCRCINALEKIGNFEKTYQSAYISIKDKKKLAKLLLKHDTPLNSDILKRFNIPKQDILPGISCPICFSRPMIHIFGTWNCPVCGEKSKTVHEQKIFDYFLLINSEISNNQFRAVTLLDSRHIANRLLNSMDLSHRGTNKGRVYFPPQK